MASPAYVRLCEGDRVRFIDQEPGVPVVDGTVEEVSLDFSTGEQMVGVMWDGHLYMMYSMDRYLMRV